MRSLGGVWVNILTVWEWSQLVLHVRQWMASMGAGVRWTFSRTPVQYMLSTHCGAFVLFYFHEKLSAAAAGKRVTLHQFLLRLRAGGGLASAFNRLHAFTNSAILGGK
jgi:hypothetical protein